MKNVLEYKGFAGSVEFSADDQVFFGKIVGIRDVVTFEGATVKELTKAFHESVNDYLETCKKMGKEPDKEFKGSFNVRVKPIIHRLIAVRSAAMKVSLNHFVEKVLEREVFKEIREIPQND
ncbi:MAG: type II toxin-antitoxin system HicB family antitoxin [Cyclobacteriaceae bacterium]|jgi:predicted HicB family RNase H-like nuclease|nr:type II toxin-antitoxin system HicB family antitoxin [Flammeovirgaceae bacterium]MCZ8022741.1 type II toxin-antitoxin system HicB family antitoxin [Cytophagales bacterium]MCZ8327556.1 type II toxin-antitoxin system HicB family antitoxin [Cyclobacteriaceae bacterium]